MRSGEQQFDASELMVPRVLHYPPLSDYPSRWPAQADDDGPALHPNHFRVESVLNMAWKSLAKDCNRIDGVQAPPLLPPVVVVGGGHSEQDTSSCSRLLLSSPSSSSPLLLFLLLLHLLPLIFPFLFLGTLAHPPRQAIRPVGSFSSATSPHFVPRPSPREAEGGLGPRVEAGGMGHGG